jgi:hypothetical protein
MRFRALGSRSAPQGGKRKNHKGRHDQQPEQDYIQRCDFSSHIARCPGDVRILWPVGPLTLPRSPSRLQPKRVAWRHVSLAAPNCQPSGKKTMRFPRLEQVDGHFPETRTSRDLSGFPAIFEPVDAYGYEMYIRRLMFDLRYRWQIAIFIGSLVLVGLFKLNIFSLGWNILVGLVVTAVLFVLSGILDDG